MIDNSILKQNLNDQVSYTTFLQALGYEENDTVYLRRFKDKNKGSDPGHNMQMTPALLDKNKATLEAFNRDDFGIFYAVNGAQTDAGVKQIRALFGDFDDCPFEEQIRRLNEFPLEASIIIMTRKSLHPYWLSSDVEVRFFRELQQRLIQQFGSDPTICNPSRVMRLPGFYHMKSDPVMVKLIKFNPELRYTQRQFHEALPALTKSAVRSSAVTVPDGEKVPVGQRHYWVVARIGEYLSRLKGKASDQSILALIESEFLARCADAGSVDMDEFRKKYLQTIQKIRARHEAEDQDPEFYSFAMAAWKEENPNKEFDSVTIGWDAVREAGERAKDRDQRIKAGLKARNESKKKNKDGAEASDDLEHRAEDDSSDDDNKLDLAQFHLHNGQGKVTGVFDFAIFHYLCQTENIFICGGVPYIYDDGVYRPDMNGAILKTKIRQLIYQQYVKAPTIKRIFELFLSAAELQVSPEQMNQYPVYWINFRNGFYDPMNHCMVGHDPKYRATNQIPHTYDLEAHPKDDIIRKWLMEIAPDSDDREMLLQFAGYCLTRDTRQQKFLILRGEGGTGKSTVIRMIETVVGADNISNISLSQLTQRFAAFGLMGKLINSCADLEVTALEDTSTLKKILGEDRISAEAKGKDAISFRNYSKLIFSTNELPVVKSEKTNGFYRRLLILTMDTIPKLKRADFFSGLKKELDAFIHECVKALERMLADGCIKESNGSKDAVRQLRKDSDTVTAYLDDRCTCNPSLRTERTVMYLQYLYYCQSMDRQPLNRNNFYRSMRLKGFSESRTSDKRFFDGVAPH